MISSKRTNLIRAKLLTYTFRELYPVWRVNNKTKINSPKDEIVLPKNTQVKIDLQSNNENKCADLIIESTPEGTVIHSVIIMSEQIYQGES